MPDAISIRDPFGKPAPGREVTRIEWREHGIEILLPDLGEGFSIKGLNTGNSYSGVAAGGRFEVSPGTYLLSSKTSTGRAPEKVGELGMNEFVAPQPYSREPFVRHMPFSEVSSGRAFTIRCVIVGLDTGDKAVVQISRVGGYGSGRRIPLARAAIAEATAAQGGDIYTAEVPADIVMPGLLEYRIILERAGGRDLVYPGSHPGDPFAWDYYDGEAGDRWQTFVAAAHEGLEVFDANKDRDATIYSFSRRRFGAEWISGPDAGRLLMKLGGGMEFFAGDKILGRKTEDFGGVVIRAKADSVVGKLKVTFMNGHGEAWSAFIRLSDSLTDVVLPFSQLAADDGFLLLPRPYPGFMPLRFFYSGAHGLFNWRDIEKIQITMEGEEVFDLESVELRP